MRARLTKLGAVLAALAALALGGSALATAAHKTTPPTPPVTQTQGNQVAPDTSSEAPADTADARSGAADTDNLQQGDQTGNDQADPQSEQAGSESGPSDGPGGYADTSPNADTRQQGQH